MHYWLLGRGLLLAELAHDSYVLGSILVPPNFFLENRTFSDYLLGVVEHRKRNSKWRENKPYLAVLSGIRA